MRMVQTSVMAGVVALMLGMPLSHGASVSKGEGAAAKAALAERMGALERQIAAWMLRRGEATAEKLPLLELSIDLRLVTRWLLAQSLAAPAGSEAQVAAWLRAEEWSDATAALEEAMGKQKDKLTFGQSNGMARLHKLTFALGEMKSAKDVDEFSRQLGVLLLLISNPGPEAEKAAPAMRPKVIKDAGPAHPSPPAPAVVAEPRTDAQTAAEAARLNVSPTLRRQLVSLAGAVVGSGAEKDFDRGAGRRLLETALEIGAGLQANIGVSQEARLRTEEQLAEGIALFMDGRTRAAGQAKVAGLQQYRQMLGQINRLKLTGEQMKQYGAVFGLARQSPELGSRGVAAVERFFEQRDRFAAKGKAQANMPPWLRRHVEDLSKQFAQASSDFGTAAAAANVKEMEQRVEEMRKAVDVLEKLEQMQPVLDSLGQFKPKGFANLERRISMSVAAILNTGSQREEAMKLLDSVLQLGKAAHELSQLVASDISAEVDKKYAGGKLSSLNGKWRGTVSEAASALAGGGQLDGGKMAHLSMVRGLYESLKRASELEGGLVAAEGLTRWVDWRPTAADLREILLPYTEGLSAAVGGYLADTPTALVEWSKVEVRYRPVVGMIIRVGAYREQCEAMPSGFIGLAAMLMTPLETSQFAAERRVSFAAGVWNSRTAVGDTAGAAEALDMLIKRAGGQ